MGLVKTSSTDEEEAVECFCGLIDFSLDELELLDFTASLGDGCFWIMGEVWAGVVTLALGDFEAAVDLRPELGDFELAAFRAGLGELVGLIELNKSLATLLAKRL